MLLHLVGFLLISNYDARNHELKIHAENPLLGLWADRIAWEPLEFREYVTTCSKCRL